jgi:hypothetical protein
MIIHNITEVETGDALVALAERAHAAERAERGLRDDEPQTELMKRREMIKAAVDAAANGVMTDIMALRAQLDELETLVIQNAARTTDSLNTHVGICEAAQIEVKRLNGVVAEMRKGQFNGGQSSIL